MIGFRVMRGIHGASRCSRFGEGSAIDIRVLWRGTVAETTTGLIGINPIALREEQIAIIGEITSHVGPTRSYPRTNRPARAFLSRRRSIKSREEEERIRSPFAASHDDDVDDDVEHYRDAHAANGEGGG